MSLPIDEVLPELLAVLRAGTSAVLQAPPGAGKTTRVPPALLHESWLAGRRIVMLEPRRLAARAAAGFMARALGEDVGGTVGYRIRFDTRVSARTRIEVVTEGVLTRLLQSDPALEDYGIVIFDEFHERSIHADLGLALTLQSRALLREDLRVLVMSATLQGEPIAQLLGAAPVISSAGRSFPVQTHYLERPREGYIEPLVARQIERALHDNDGDVLVFLPGAAEIRRTQEQLVVGAGADVLPLYGNLTQAEQDRAIAPSMAGRRKVVLATSIAETSLTIEGVRVVIDSGLMRVPRFDARVGMTRLDTITVTRASAEQRCGRAGRLGPGVCYRLWTRYEQEALVPHGTPEIMEADLAPLALDLAAWGTTDPYELPWLDAPSQSAYAQARELLLELAAVDARGHITPHGRELARIPAHPRIAHMLVRARELEAAALACDVAALIAERDIMRGHQPDPDLRLRVDAMRGKRVQDVDHGGLQRARREADQLRRALGVAASSRVGDESLIGVLLAFAYPDRIAQRRDARGRYLLRNGRGATVDAHFNLAGEEFLAIATLDGRGRDSRVYLAAPLSEADVRAYFGEQIEREETVDLQNGKARAFTREKLGAIVLAESQNTQLGAATIAAALAHAVRTDGVGVLRWSEAARTLQQRVQFLRGLDDAWPDWSDAALQQSVDEWLLPMLAGVRALQDIDVQQALEAQLPWAQRSKLDELAPTHLEVPTGSMIRVDYSNPAAPTMAVRLQEVFGMRETPRIGATRVPVTMQLLSPAQRPVQVTRDLASFWRSGYFEVKKELKGRYPKHYWPDDPLVAEAVRGIRRRRS